MVLADDELRADLKDTPHLPLLVGNCDFAEGVCTNWWGATTRKQGTSGS